MWRNYLTVGFRSLIRNKAYGAINILGLALGLAACLLILLYVRYETTYDKWLPDSDRIYQVQATWREPGQPVSKNQASPLAVRETLKGGFPQIEALSIALPSKATIVRDGQPLSVEALFVDPAFFDIFKLPFVDGSAARALPEVTSVVFTRSEAIKQFGTVQAVGRTITAGSGKNRKDYTVTGVVEDLPSNSHMKAGAFFRFNAGAYAPEDLLSWGNMSQYHYVKLPSGASADAINAALPAWEKRVIPPQMREGRMSSRADVMDLKLTNVVDVHLGEAQLLSMTPGSDRRTIATFSVVAVLILVMACINFINLSTARAGQRAREVSLRKVLGASRGQLVVQFIGESILLVGVAMLLALTLVELAVPRLAAYLDADLRVSYFGPGGFLVPAAVLTLVVGVLGGLYPALYLSRFQPAEVLRANKSSAEPRGSGRLRNLLVVSQFAISIGLIVCTWVVYSQTRFVQTFDPGFEREGLIQVGGAWRAEEAGNYESLRREIASVPGVVGVSRTGLGIVTDNKSIQSVQLPQAGDTIDVGVYTADPDLFSTMGMRLLGGRLLGERFANDRVARDPEGKVDPAMMSRGANIVINRKAASMFGFASPAAAVGKQVKAGIDGSEPIPATIVGVVEDTRIRTARDEIEPLIYTYDPAQASDFIIRYRSNDPSAVMSGIEGAWRRFFDAAFNGAFAEDLVAELYGRERARATIFALFSLLAVIISCLGLFGLASFQTERRTKEIGIRKVLGAKVRDIVKLLAWQFSKPVIIANLIAWPVAWWAMRDWLNTFDARIPLGPTPFVLAAIIALAIAIGTVAGHAIRVARLNPIHALRYE